MTAAPNPFSMHSAAAAWLLRRKNALVRASTHAAAQRPGAFLQ